MWLLLISMLAQDAGERKLIIFLGKETESQIIRSELTRDWNKPRDLMHAKLGQNPMQTLNETLQLKVELRVATNYERTPYYRYGEYGCVERFDPHSFMASGSFLLALEVIDHNLRIDLAAWRSKCEELHRVAEYEHIDRITRWLKVHYPHRLESYQQEVVDSEDGHLLYCFDEMQRRFKNYYSIPVYVPPAVPAKPFKLQQWELPRLRGSDQKR